MNVGVRGRLLSLGLVLAAVALSWLPASAADGRNAAQAHDQAGVIRLFVTNALREPLNAILPEVQNTMGKHLSIAYASSHDLEDRIMGGDAFDVAILVPTVNEELFRAGKIRPDAYEIARVPVAIGIRGNAKVDISARASLKDALLKAKSVKYLPTGAAIMTVNTVLSKLNIAKAIHDSSWTQTEVPLASGEYELSFYPVSEIGANSKWRNLGPVIAEFQSPVTIQAVIESHADAKAARSLISFLQGPEIDGALKNNGMTKSVTASRFRQAAGDRHVQP